MAIQSVGPAQAAVTPDEAPASVYGYAPQPGAGDIDPLAAQPMAPPVQSTVPPGMALAPPTQFGVGPGYVPQQAAAVSPQPQYAPSPPGYAAAPPAPADQPYAAAAGVAPDPAATAPAYPPQYAPTPIPQQYAAAVPQQPGFAPATWSVGPTRSASARSSEHQLSRRCADPCRRHAAGERALGEPDGRRSFRQHCRRDVDVRQPADRRHDHHRLFYALGHLFKFLGECFSGHFNWHTVRELAGALICGAAAAFSFVCPAFSLVNGAALALDMTLQVLDDAAREREAYNQQNRQQMGMQALPPQPLAQPVPQQTQAPSYAYPPAAPAPSYAYPLTAQPAGQYQALPPQYVPDAQAPAPQAMQ